MKTIVLILLVLALGYGCMSAMNPQNDGSEPPFRFDLPKPTDEPKEEKPSAPKNNAAPKPSKPVPYHSEDNKTFYI